jgi:uncharacterized protein (TIGR02466 family)
MSTNGPKPMSQQANFVAGELSRAVQLHQAGNLDAANAIYDRILEADPEHADALNLSGVIAHQTGNQETAIRLIEDAIRINDANASYFNNLGEAYRAFGQNHRAIDAFEQALRINPRDVAANNNLGLALQSQQRYEEARSAYARALQFAPDDVEVWLNLGNLHREFCHLGESAGAFRKAIGIRPELAAGHASLGLTLYESGDSEAAVASLLKAVNLDPLYLEAHENLKKIRWFRGEHDRVDESFRNTCEQLPHSGRAFSNLGAALFVSQDYLNAEKALLRATQLEPDMGDAHHTLAQVYRDLDRFEQSVAAHEKAIAITPKNAIFREEFGATLILAGKFGRAASELRIGHEIDPRRSAILAFLTIALNELGDPSVRELVDYEKFVRVARIDVPDGYDSLEAFNADLHDELAKQHQNPYHPMDQTMRGGTQTRNNLFQNPTGLVRVLKEQISKVILAFIDDLVPDARHPFLRFINRDFVFTGVWSTIIKEHGFDRSHIHNEGWMSGTYYAKIPEFDESQLSEHAGCIQFGEPNKRYTSKRNATQRIIPPQVGTVVLFPSYYWHGVRAFDRNGVRHSISYDLI